MVLHIFVLFALQCLCVLEVELAWASKKVFFLFVHILHGFAHFGPFCTPISVPFDFVSGACLRIQ
jgi:hypothetical protein